jgi:VIT1/CCC1 family predicted Fe2+/Mn2+ transporter
MFAARFWHYNDWIILGIFHFHGRAGMPRIHKEQHRMERIGWLRAAVLGANDGILSTASLIVGVAAAHAARSNVLLAGIAALVAGAMSMAAGEYVSVSSQADTEEADLTRERLELKDDLKNEQDELATIYVKRGLDQKLARQVALQLMEHDALGAHARDELGISADMRARPVQAALASAGSFAAGAIMPLLTVLIAPEASLIPIVILVSLVVLAGLGALSARTGGSPIVRATFRVTFWGALAMAITYAVGALFGTIV